MDCFVVLSAIVTPILAGIAVWFSYLNHRATTQAREESKLPKIGLYELNGWVSFRLETDSHSVGWKVVRIEVIDALRPPNTDTKILQKSLKKIETEDGIRGSFGPTGEWSDFLDYPEGAQELEFIEFHPDCSVANFSFICETPSRIWWRPWRKQRKRVPCKYQKGEMPPMSDDPLLRPLIP